MKLCLALSALALCACGANPVAQIYPQQKVQVGGDSYLISQITAGTWMAVAQDSGKPVPRSLVGRALLLNAIAKTSGCRVTDTNYSPDGLQLDAQVDCGGLTRN